jgi:hypothetical protein
MLSNKSTPSSSWGSILSLKLDEKYQSVSHKPRPSARRIWQHSRTRLGRVVAIVFSTEALCLLLLCVCLRFIQDVSIGSVAQHAPLTNGEGETVIFDTLSGEADKHIRAPSPMTGSMVLDTLTRIPYLWGIFVQWVILCITHAVCASSLSSLPASKSKRHLLHLPVAAVYSPMLLHQAQSRSRASASASPTHRRRLILAAKIIVFLLLTATLWCWVSMPGIHRACLGEDLQLLLTTRAHPNAESGTLVSIASTWRAALTSALLALDAFATCWAFAAAAITLPAWAMSALVCFAWTRDPFYVPDFATVEELRAMVKAEEAVVEEESVVLEEEEGEEEENSLHGVVGITPALFSWVWALRDWLAGLGEVMVDFASRHC